MTRIYICLAISALLASGCKGGSDEPAAATAASAATTSAKPAAPAIAVPAACDVFTAAELGAALGATVTWSASTAPEAKNADGLPRVSCKWEQGTSPEDHAIDMTIEKFAAAEPAKKVLASMRVASSRQSFSQLYDLGDEAVAVLPEGDKRTKMELAWRKDTTLYKMTVTRAAGLDPDKVKDAIVKVVRAKKF